MSKQKLDRPADAAPPVTPPAGFGPPPQPETETSTAAPLRQDQRPLCPYHQVQCEARSSPRIGSAFFTYYYCPHPGCTFSQKVPRKTIAQRLDQENDAGFSAR